MRGFSKTEKTIFLLKSLRLGFIPIVMIMYYMGTRAWGSSIGFLLALVFGFAYFQIVNSSITYVVGMEFKIWVEDMIKKVTEKPAYVEFSRNYGMSNLLVFFQDVDEGVVVLISGRIVEKRQSDKRFSRIRTVSFARVPSLDKDTIEKFRGIMKVNILKAELERRDRK